MKMRVMDCHCDTAFELWSGKKELAGSGLQIDLAKTGALEGYAQFFALWTFPGLAERYGRPVPEIFDAVLENFLAQLRKHSDLAVQARTPQEVQAAVEAGKTAAVLSIEGPAGLDYDPGRLADLYEKGFRMTTLGWNEQNPLAGSHVTGGGLTARGREYAKTAQRLGYILDVSHLSEQGFWQLCDLAEKPIIASHSNSRRVWGVSRNLTDEQFRAICDLGGVAGVNLYTDFLGREPVTLDTVCDHVLHFLELGGAKHIALGGDLDGCESLPRGFAGPQDYPKLARALEDRGVDESVIEDLFWKNAMRVFALCCI